MLLPQLKCRSKDGILENTLGQQLSVDEMWIVPIDSPCATAVSICYSAVAHQILGTVWLC